MQIMMTFGGVSTLTLNLDLVSIFIVSLIERFDTYFWLLFVLLGDIGETLRAIIHTRLVIVMCFLVLLFLTSCYAASLTSLLTAQQQRSPIRTLDELIRKRVNIGNQKGSFVPRLLVQRGFTEDQIHIYDTEQEMVDMLAKGSVAAVIDETPYLKVFLSKNCNKGYTLVPSFDLHAEGFGFVSAPLYLDYCLLLDL